MNSIEQIYVIEREDDGKRVIPAAVFTTPASFDGSWTWLVAYSRSVWGAGGWDGAFVSNWYFVCLSSPGIVTGSCSSGHLYSRLSIDSITEVMSAFGFTVDLLDAFRLGQMIVTKAGKAEVDTEIHSTWNTPWKSDMPGVSEYIASEYPIQNARRTAYYFATEQTIDSAAVFSMDVFQRALNVANTMEYKALAGRLEWFKEDWERYTHELADPAYSHLVDHKRKWQVLRVVSHDDLENTVPDSAYDEMDFNEVLIDMIAEEATVAVTSLSTCDECGNHFFVHNDDGSCIEDFPDDDEEDGSVLYPWEHVAGRGVPVRTWYEDETEDGGKPMLFRYGDFKDQAIVHWKDGVTVIRTDVGRAQVRFVGEYNDGAAYTVYKNRPVMVTVDYDADSKMWNVSAAWYVDVVCDHPEDHFIGCDQCVVFMSEHGQEIDF